jgi:hypothetical protein
MGIILFENRWIYLKKGHFSSFFDLHFVGSKTREFGSSAFCRAIDSLQNSIYGYTQKFQNVTDFVSQLLWSRGEEWSEQAHIGNHYFYFINFGYDIVFDGLSESEIKFSAGATSDRKMVKIQNDEKWPKQV